MTDVTFLVVIPIIIYIVWIVFIIVKENLELKNNNGDWDE